MSIELTKLRAASIILPMLDFWKNDILQNIIVSQFMRRGGQPLGNNEGAIMIKDNISGVICLSAVDEQAGKELLTVYEDYDLLLLSQPLMMQYVNEAYGLVCETPCYQAVYTKCTPLTLKGNIDIRVADDDELEKIIATYRFADPDELNETRGRGMLFAAHEGGKFCGYIGEHSEGSMGMLEIFPEFRGKGYALELESFMINRKLEAGCTPYCHIIYDNAASLSLQKKLGLEIADKFIYWAHKKR